MVTETPLPLFFFLIRIDLICYITGFLFVFKFCIVPDAEGKLAMGEGMLQRDPHIGEAWVGEEGKGGLVIAEVKGSVGLEA